MTDMNTFAKTVEATRKYPSAEGVSYVTLGLCGEAGEIANRWKKALRKGDDVASCRDELIDELGDVMWYAFALASELNVNMEHVLRRNMEKVEARAKAGDTTAINHKVG